VKKPVSKAQVRKELHQQMNNFLKRGGEVEQIEKGLSGRDNADGPLKPNSMTFDQEKTPRTYVPEVIAAIDARRKSKPKPAVQKKAGKKPHKKLIYDDFGEPLRWEWVE
jgi:hypothetical protein